jgi:methylglutaconyl-CoA hydratase
VSTPAPEIASSVEAGVGSVLLNRPEKRNALSRSMIAALGDALASADDDAAVRVITLSGAGSDFCSGMDLGELRETTRESVAENLADVDRLADLFLVLRRLRKPVVALVRGRALAGGCGLATACDLVLASESASFGYPEVRIGFVPAMVAGLLRRNVGEKRAFEMITRGEILSAAEAERVGLINRVFADADFDERAGRYVAELGERSPLALQLCKRVLYQQDGLGFEAAVRAGADVNVIARASEELARGVDGFLAARAARPEG